MNLARNSFALLVLAGLAFPETALARGKYAAGTVLLTDALEYVKMQKAPDFWALIPHYVPQDPGFCQTASLAPILNAIRDRASINAETKNVTQEELVRRVSDPAWTKAMRAKKCYALDEYAGIVRKALPLFTKRRYDVRVVHASAAADPKLREAILADLEKNETGAEGFIIANFDQAVFTGESESAGHVSPIAAYDKGNRRILILDVDREWYEPYWVTEDAFFKAISTGDKAAKKTRGYLVIEPAAG